MLYILSTTPSFFKTPILKIDLLKEWRKLYKANTRQKSSRVALLRQGRLQNKKDYKGEECIIW